MCNMSSGYLLRRAVLDSDFVVTALAVLVVVDFWGALAAFATATSVFSGMQGMEPSERSGVRRGGPSPINILVIGS